MRTKSKGKRQLYRAGIFLKLNVVCIARLKDQNFKPEIASGRVVGVVVTAVAVVVVVAVGSVALG